MDPSSLEIFCKNAQCGDPEIHTSMLAQAARGRFACLDSPLCEFRFHVNGSVLMNSYSPLCPVASEV